MPFPTLRAVDILTGVVPPEAASRWLVRLPRVGGKNIYKRHKSNEDNTVSSQTLFVLGELHVFLSQLNDI